MVDTYDDFAAWMDDRHDWPTVGEAGRYFTATPHDVIVAWMREYCADRTLSFYREAR